ncbi:MAG TPA: RES family NAD+ phosphorylase [Candidatus Acidoferrales bacterium]|nr:RES family NAD+ phosphorylase [Candidatus Acidoferrales bacterium]
MRRRRLRLKSPDRATKPAARGALPFRTLAGTFWHQCSPRRRLLDLANPAVTSGRYHRAGGPGVWYASSSENGAWAELFRHHEAGGVSPSEVTRRIGRARIKELRVLDLTDASVREAIGVSAEELTGDDLARCQEIAQRAQRAGFDGILAPSAALDGQQTLVVFATAMRKVVEQSSGVGQPPAHARRMLRRVRSRPAS